MVRIKTVTKFFTFERRVDHLCNGDKWVGIIKQFKTEDRKAYQNGQCDFDVHCDRCDKDFYYSLINGET